MTAPEKLTPEQEARKQECLRRAAEQLARVTIPARQKQAS